MGKKPRRDIKFGVITKIPPESDDGNKYDHIIEPEDIRVDLWPTKFMQIPDQQFSVRLQNFELGEILVLNDYGREISGRERKPGKWFVVCEEFDSIDKAIKRAEQVMKGGSA